MMPQNQKGAKKFKEGSSLMRKYLYFCSFIFLIAFTGCSKKVKHADLTMKTSEMYQLLNEHDIQEDKRTENAIRFSEYSMGVSESNSRSLVFQELNFYVIEYPNEESARREAKRLNQFYVKNWLIDKVAGEPILEGLVIKALKAKNDY